MIDLKPCPLCGAEAKLHEIRDFFGDACAYVRCTDCGLIGARVYDWNVPDGESKSSAAVEIWNIGAKMEVAE